MFRCQVTQKDTRNMEQIILPEEDSSESSVVEHQKVSDSHPDQQIPSTSQYFNSQTLLNPAKRFKPSSSGSVFKGLDSIKTKDVSELNTLFAKFLIENNIPFDVVGSKYLNEFLKKLRPAYKVPDVHSFATTITDELYADSMMKIRKESTETAILILTKEDGKFIAHIKTLFGQQVFLGEIDCFTSSTTEAINTFVQEALTQFNHEIKSLVEDCLSQDEVNQTEFKDLSVKSHSIYLETVTEIASNPQLASEITELLDAFNIVNTPNKDR